MTTSYNTETTTETSSFLKRLPIRRQLGGKEEENPRKEEEEKKEQKENKGSEGRKKKKEDDCQKMLEVWNETVQAKLTPDVAVFHSPLRLQKLQRISNEVFGNDKKNGCDTVIKSQRIGS